MTLPKNWPSLSALTLGALIADGVLDPVSLTEAAIERISARDPLGKVFLHGSEDRALTEAIAAHDRAKRGLRRSPLDGVPTAWKDNIEAIGAPTTNGSAILRHHIAARDAQVLQRGVRAGLVTLGKTALTEFAFSGLGYNPTMGSPDNPFDPDVPRAPGGSSCGSAVAVALGLSPLGVGTDTAGSVRIPAAWNGLVGLKTTAGSIPLDGILPLSPVFDTVGPMSRTIADAAALWSILARMPAPDLHAPDLRRLSLILPSEVQTEADDDVWQVFSDALDHLGRAGARVASQSLDAITMTQALIDQHGTPVAAEGWARWKEEIEASPKRVYDNVRMRMKNGAETMSGASFAHVTAALSALGRRYVLATAHADAIILPTVATVPPRIADLETEADYSAANLRALRFTRLANLLGLSALTLPCGLTKAEEGQPPLPVGLMLMGPPHAEARLLQLGAVIERALPETPLPIS